MFMELPIRKPTRLKGYDYSEPGAYFVTICVKDRKPLLSEITVGDDEGIVPKNHTFNYGLNWIVFTMNKDPDRVLTV